MLSIVTPVLNGAEYIRENIESIRQLAVPFEHIIVDGGSTDETLNIISEYPHLTLLHQTEKLGMYHAIDMGFSIASGDYICWINCDDRIILDGFSKMYNCATTNNYDFIASDGIMNYIHRNKNFKIKSTKFLKYFLQKGFFPFLQPSTIYKKELYNRVNGLNYSRFKIIGDQDLFHRMSKIQEAKFGYVKCLSSVFLKHGNSLGDRGTNLSLIERKSSNITEPTKINRILLKISRFFNI